ncbi:MAG: delta-60 repeat domain-containing protein, partial [Opitutaceae bacterium]
MFSVCIGRASSGATRFELDPTLGLPPLAGPVASKLSAFPLADGSVLVSGEFKSVNGVAAGALVKLDSSGEVANARFAAALFDGAGAPTIRPLVRLADGAVLFSQANAADGTLEGRLKRTTAGGEVDLAYALVLAPAPNELA